jgi:hypothetical protein
VLYPELSIPMHEQKGITQHIPTYEVIFCSENLPHFRISESVFRSKGWCMHRVTACTLVICSMFVWNRDIYDQKLVKRKDSEEQQVKR